MPTADELIAHGHDVEGIAKLIGADRLIYQDLEDLIAAVRAGNPALTEFDCSVFTGEYVTADIDEGYLQRLEDFRSDAAKNQRESQDEEILELHNVI